MRGLLINPTARREARFAASRQEEPIHLPCRPSPKDDSLELTEKQSDAIAELLNIAFSRTADSLSRLAGQRVHLDPPRVETLELAQLVEIMTDLEGHEVAAIGQPFNGDFSGDAVLIFDHTAAVRLAALLSPGRPVPNLTAATIEVLTEVGNILLTACVGMFGNVLNVRIGFAVPRLQVARLNAILDSMDHKGPDRRRAIVAFTSFRLQESTIKADLVIVLGISSLDNLVGAVERLG